MPFTNQVAIVTGASSGIGYEVAKELARQGAKVGVMARREDLLRQLCEEIGKEGGQADFASVDITNRQETNQRIHELAERLGGPVDLLVANAGVGSTNTSTNLNVSGGEQVIRVNLLGVMYSIEAVLPKMMERRQGHIVAISSLAAFKGIPWAAAYCASKSAVNAYIESLRIGYHFKNIHFSTICPGFIRTPMTETNKGMFLVMDADRAARKIVRAIERKKKVYCFPWITERLIKLTYWLPDWILCRTMPEQIGGKEPEVKG